MSPSVSKSKRKMDDKWQFYSAKRVDTRALQLPENNLLTSLIKISFFCFCAKNRFYICLRKCWVMLIFYCRKSVSSWKKIISPKKSLLWKDLLGKISGRHTPDLKIYFDFCPGVGNTGMQTGHHYTKIFNLLSLLGWLKFKLQILI